MQFDRKQLQNSELRSIYEKMLYARMIEEKMLLLLRQGKISKWFSGIGQEAIACGVAHSLAPDDWIMPLHRNLGVFTGRGIPLHTLFMQWQGNKEGFTNGRDRSFHFGSPEHHICGMISHLGPQMAVADGTALAAKLKRQQLISLAFCGDGGTSEGDFHEALNVAAVWDLPVIFLIENNGYGLSTPVSEQYRCEKLSDRAKGYGMHGITIDGNNILTVIDTLRGVREYCLCEQKPYLVECMTFRMRGHEEASGTKYVPAELLDYWKALDPLVNYETFLLEAGTISSAEIKSLKEQCKNSIEAELQKGFNASEIFPDEQEELMDVYAPAVKTTTAVKPGSLLSDEQNSRFIDGVRDGLYQSMQVHENLVLMGQDIAEYGGAFKITDGFLEKFGRERVRNTPLCESAIIGAALGLSLEGYKSMVEMQFADFISSGFNQVVNNLAKIHYRWGVPADVVIRMPTGGGVGAGPFHSQNTEAWFTHVPGLQVVYPSTPADAKGLLIAAINDPNPVMYFEHKALYRSIAGAVPSHYYEIPLGSARIVQEGTDMTIITYGAGVYWASAFSERNPGISCCMLDLRCLLPLDYEAIANAVKKTGRVIVLHEDSLTGGFGAEIAAWIAEHCFEWLDAPVMRCASLDTPIPFNKALENQFLAESRLQAMAGKLMAF